MKKLFAIFMLGVYLFNLAGYSFLFNYYILKADQQANQKAENQLYSESTLKEIKIKLNLPYITDWSAYETFRGEVEVDGVHYNYVKRKVCQDTLYLLCLPNEMKTQLNQLKNAYAVRANDLPAEKQDKMPVPVKGMMAEAGPMHPIQIVIAPLLTILPAHQLSYVNHTIADNYLPVAGQPPEQLIG